MALTIGINELLHGDLVESNRLELKSGWNPDSIIHTICAFANDLDSTNGGFVIIGVEEENGLFKQPVKGLDPKDIDAIQKDIVNKCHFIRPLYVPRIDVVTYLGKHLIVLTCTAGQDGPYYAPKSVFANQSEKSVYVRLGSLTAIATQSQLRDLYDQCQIIPFDDRHNPYIELSDISPFYLFDYLREVQSDLASLSDSGLFPILESMELARGNPHHPEIKNAAVLLFGKEESLRRLFPYAYIEMVIMPSADGRQMSEFKFDGPIIKSLRDALTKFSNLVLACRVSKSDTDPKTQRVWNYPYPAVKEVLANAVYHRDYKIHEPITVLVTPSFLEVKSFPGLNASINLDSINKGEPQRRGSYRNRLLGNYLKEAGLTEGRRTGVPRIFSSMEANGSDKATFLMDGERESLTVHLPVQKQFLDGSNGIEMQLVKQDGDLKSKILMTLSPGPLSRRAIAASLGYKGISARFAATIVKMEEEGLIQSSGNGRAKKYRLASRR